MHVNRLVEETSADAGILFFHNPTTGGVEIVAQTVDQAWDEGPRYAFRDSPVLDILRHNHSVMELDVSAQRTDEYRNLLGLLYFESVIGVQIQTADGINHALFLFHRRPNAFDRFRLRDAWATATLCAAVLEREQTQQRLTAVAGLLLSGELAAGLSHEVFNKLSGLELSMVNLQSECTMLQNEVSQLAKSARYTVLADNMGKPSPTARICAAPWLSSSR